MLVFASAGLLRPSKPLTIRTTRSTSPAPNGFGTKARMPVISDNVSSGDKILVLSPSMVPAASWDEYVKTVLNSHEHERRTRHRERPLPSRVHRVALAGEQVLEGDADGRVGLEDHGAAFRGLADLEAPVRAPRRQVWLPLRIHRTPRYPDADGFWLR